MIDSIDSLSGGLIKCLLQASQEETAMPCYLVLLAVCFMNWLFGDQVSCHTLLLRAEVMYVNDHLLFDHR